MNRMKLSDWFEKKYLEWQISNGRISITKFSKVLGISPSYLSQLMSGRNKGISYDLASQLCLFFDDWSLFEILGFDKPSVVDNLTNEFKYRLEKAAEEAERSLKEKNLTGEMPEAEQTIIEIFERFGFKYTDTNIS
jgi:transcriptional regulator with XRE-family HTH domain